MPRRLSDSSAAGVGVDRVAVHRGQSQRTRLQTPTCTTPLERIGAEREHVIRQDGWHLTRYGYLGASAWDYNKVVDPRYLPSDGMATCDG